MKYKYPRIKPIYPLYQLNKEIQSWAQLGITIEFDDDEGLIEETFPGRMIEDRYLANVNYFSRYCKADDDRFEIQEKINNLKILLLGLGGGGSNILTLLAGLGPKMIRMVDYDRVEASNLGRQLLYREADIGEKKTVVAKRSINEMNSNINVETVDKNNRCE